MFTALYFKEWKEKATIFFFELGILALLIPAQFVLHEKKDIREWLIYAMLMLFYPFAALILGASGFEAEYRQGAWAYLFSRPVSRVTVWLAKLAALTSMLTALWLVFTALWAAVPAIRELVGGTRVWLKFDFASEFPWWSILASFFFLIVTFSLSLLHERQFNILFLALGICFLLPTAAWAFLNTKAGGFLAWIAPEKALSTLIPFLVLIALAFAGASVMTLVRSDFSQPRKLTFGFVRQFAMFLVLVLAGTAAWALLVPPPGSRYLYSVAFAGGEAFFDSERGIFKYSAEADRIRWLAKAKGYGYGWTTASSGKVAYTAYDIKSKDDVAGEVWVMNSDGRGRKRIIGRDLLGKGWPGDESFDDLLLSPDGAKLAILSSKYDEKRKVRAAYRLRIVPTDGTRPESLPDSPSLFGDTDDRFWVRMMSWALGGEAILLYKRGHVSKGAYVYPESGGDGLWLYDLRSRSARRVLENGAPAVWTSSGSRRGDLVAVKYEKAPGRPHRLALLDLATSTLTDVLDAEGGGEANWTVCSWDPKGERLTAIAKRAQPGGPDVFVLNVYSPSAGKIVAERVMTKTEGTAMLYAPSWTADGARLVILDREAGALRVLDLDLRDVDRIEFPRWAAPLVGLTVVGDKALVTEQKTDSLLRCDLKKKSWKRLY